MGQSWPVAATGSACGFTAVLGIFIARGILRKQWSMSLSKAIAVFLTAGALPTAFAFFLYPFPFFDPKPSLDDHLLYLPVAGFGILWLVFEVIKTGIDGSPNGTARDS
jgi:hypothetical protein